MSKCAILCVQYLECYLDSRQRILVLPPSGFVKLYTFACVGQFSSGCDLLVLKLQSLCLEIMKNSHMGGFLDEFSHNLKKLPKGNVFAFHIRHRSISLTFICHMQSLHLQWNQKSVNAMKKLKKNVWCMVSRYTFVPLCNMWFDSVNSMRGQWGGVVLKSFIIMGHIQLNFILSRPDQWRFCLINFFF